MFFTANVTAEEIVMKCKFKKYKYITQDLGNIILTTKKKGEPKWVGWCPDKKTEDNKHWFVSAKNRELIISDLKGICMIEKGELDAAIPWLVKAINAKRYDTYWFPWLNLGRIQERKGNWVEALECFKSSIHCNPTYVPALKAINRIRGRLN